MRLAELSRRSGLPTATIKYYLRAGLLPPGLAEAGTWASYDEAHLRRLRLVRALSELAGLALDDVRRVVDAVDAAGSVHDVLGAAQWPLSAPPAAEPSAGALALVESLLSRRGWRIASSSPHRQSLARALDTLEELGFPASAAVLDVYAEALEPVAEVEVSRVAEEPEPVLAAERLVIGTLLYEPVLLTLRRMAHEAVSARR